MKHTTPPIPKAVTRTWAIGGTVPNPNPSEPGVYYNSNFQVGVEALTMEQAIEKARQVFPTAIFNSCHNRGDIHIATT